MTDTSKSSFQSVFHPTDFSTSSNVAFDHALRIALGNRSRLAILHVGSNDDGDAAWSGFPRVRKTLQDWGLLETDSPREAVADELGVKVTKAAYDGTDPLAAIGNFLQQERSDLIVLATQGREGLPRWLSPSVSERLARRSRIATLFVPAGTRGFVSKDRGDVELKRVLIPVDHNPGPQVAVDAAGALLRSINADGSQVHAVFIGADDHMPEVEPPAGSNFSFERSARSGKPVDEIVKTANEGSADLIVMATEGHDGFLDALRGSTTEQVLRRAPCPVLAVPAATS